MKRINVKATVIGIKAGIISSLCCILPLILVTLGLVSMGTALGIVRYKPYFIGLSVIFLVSSLILYFKKNKTCCNINRNLFIGTAIITHVLVFITLLYVLVPTIAPSVYTGFSTTSFVTQSSTINSHKLILKINGMTCSGCAYGIQHQLQQLNGVTDAKVSFLEGIGEIVYNSDKITKEEIRDSIKSPYSAIIINSKTVNEF